MNTRISLEDQLRHAFGPHYVGDEATFAPAGDDSGREWWRVAHYPADPGDPDTIRVDVWSTLYESYTSFTVIGWDEDGETWTISFGAVPRLEFLTTFVEHAHHSGVGAGTYKWNAHLAAWPLDDPDDADLDDQALYEGDTSPDVA